MHDGGQVLYYFSKHNGILLLLLASQPIVGFSLISAFLPFCPFLTQLSPPSYSHYLYIFFDVLNPSFPWSSSVSPTCWFPLQYSFKHSFSFHPHHVTQSSHSFAFYKSHHICVFYSVVQLVIRFYYPEPIFILHWTKDFSQYSALKYSKILFISVC